MREHECDMNPETLLKKALSHSATPLQVRCAALVARLRLRLHPLRAVGKKWFPLCALGLWTLALTVAAYLAWTRQALLLSWRALARSHLLFQQADIGSDIAFGCYCVGCDIVPPPSLYRIKKCRLLRELTRSPCVSRYSFLPAVPAAHSARTCTYRSMLWWLGFAFFKEWGCAVAESDRACICYSRQQRKMQRSLNSLAGHNWRSKFALPLCLSVLYF